MKTTLKLLRKLIREEIDNVRYNKTMEKFQTVDDAVSFLVKNWTLITGEQEEQMHEEGFWPEAVDEFIESTGFDHDDFQNAWTLYFG